MLNSRFHLIITFLSSSKRAAAAMADDGELGGASLEIFLALLALVMLLLLLGGLYLLRDRARGTSDHMSRSFLARCVRAPKRRPLQAARGN